jgi:YD repeat-containing protein
MSKRLKLFFAIAVPILLSAIGTDALATSVKYNYDLLGRVATAYYDNGTCVAYTYDANGNRTTQTNTASGAPVTPTWGTGVWGCFQWTP